MEYLKVRNFEEFQHYKHRNPPWIRLYRELLEDKNFYKLEGSLKFQIIGMFLLASQCDNKISADPEWIQSKIRSVEPVSLQALIGTGFIEERKQRASKTLAERTQPATPETDNSETETETETEKSREGKHAADDPRRVPFIAFCFSSWKENRGADLLTDASDFKAVKTLLKASAGKPIFELPELQTYWLRFLDSKNDFHQTQGRPLRFFCLNINAFVTEVKNGNGKESYGERVARKNRELAALINRESCDSASNGA